MKKMCMAQRAASASLMLPVVLALAAGNAGAAGQVLAKDTALSYCANPPILFKGGTSVTTDAKNLVVSGVLAKDTKLSYNANPPILFKAGTGVSFQTTNPDRRCLVVQGTLAKATKLYHVSNVGAPQLFGAGTNVTFNKDGLVIRP